MYVYLILSYLFSPLALISVPTLSEHFYIAMIPSGFPFILITIALYIIVKVHSFIAIVFLYGYRLFG